MPATHLECAVYARQLYLQMPVRIFCHTGNIALRHQCIAMNTHKLIGKLLLQSFQRLLD